LWPSENRIDLPVEYLDAASRDIRRALANGQTNRGWVREGEREGLLLDTMFDLPSLEGVEEVVISKEVVEGAARPLYIYADRADRGGDASAS
jgi:ATP-dependent protease Clp ATPase subunit